MYYWLATSQKLGNIISYKWFIIIKKVRIYTLTRIIFRLFKKNQNLIYKNTTKKGNFNKKKLINFKSHICTDIMLLF